MRLLIAVVWIALSFVVVPGALLWVAVQDHWTWVFLFYPYMQFTRWWLGVVSRAATQQTVTRRGNSLVAVVNESVAVGDAEEAT